MLGVAGRDEIGALLDALAANDTQRLLAAGDDLATRSLDLASLLDELQRAFHDLAVAAELNVVPATPFERFRDAFSREDLQLYYQIALMGRRDLEFAPDPKIGFDMSLLRLASFELAGGSAGGMQRPEASDSAGPTTGQAASEAVRHRPEAIASGEAAAQPAVAESAGDWHEIVSAMSPEGVTGMILRNTNLVAREDGRWSIRLDAAHESLLNDKQRREVVRLASEFSGREVSVAFEIGELTAETPSARDSRVAEQSRAKAEATLLADANVNALLSEFGGRLDSARLSGEDA